MQLAQNCTPARFCIVSEGFGRVQSPMSNARSSECPNPHRNFDRTPISEDSAVFEHNSLCNLLRIARLLGSALFPRGLGVCNHRCPTRGHLNVPIRIEILIARQSVRILQFSSTIRYATCSELHACSVLHCFRGVWACAITDVQRAVI